MKRLNFSYKFLVCSLIIIILSCSEREHSNPLDPGYSGNSYSASQKLIENGWELFEQKKFRDAKTSFYKAIYDYTPQAEAATGLGWSYAMIGKLDSAKLHLEWAENRDYNNSDTQAGLAVIFRDLPAYTLAIKYAESVLDRSRYYAFSHNDYVNYKVLRLIIAQSCIRLGQAHFAKAQEQINILWPGNDLEPNRSVTWYVDHVQYDSYSSALIAAIEYIQNNL